MKYAKLLRTACLAAALVCGAAVGNAKNGVEPKMYMFGFAASFNDTIVHFTDVQEVDSAWMNNRNGFLLGREFYSGQLRDYLRNQQQMTARTCLIMFSKSRSKAEKKLVKLRKLYTNSKDGKKHFDVRYLSESDFHFKAVNMDPNNEENENDEAAPRKKKNKK
jgi:hypothetical protein